MRDRQVTDPPRAETRLTGAAPSGLASLPRNPGGQDWSGTHLYTLPVCLAPSREQGTSWERARGRRATRAGHVSRPSRLPSTAGSSRPDSSQRPTRKPTERRPGRRVPTAEPGTAGRSPPNPSKWARRRRAPRPQPGLEGLACRSTSPQQPLAGRPYFIELALSGLAQGWVHGAPKGLDDGVGIHRRAVGQTRDTGATEAEIAPLTAHMDRPRSAAATGAKGKRSAKAPDRTFSPRRGGGRCSGHFLSALPRSTLGNVVRKRRQGPRGWLPQNSVLEEKTFKRHKEKSKIATKFYMISLENLKKRVMQYVVTNCIIKRNFCFVF